MRYPSGDADLTKVLVELDAALAQVAMLREALAEDVADGENVPGLTTWLVNRRPLLADTAGAVTDWLAARDRATRLATIEEGRALLARMCGLVFWSAFPYSRLASSDRIGIAQSAQVIVKVYAEHFARAVPQTPPAPEAKA